MSFSTPSFAPLKDPSGSCNVFKPQNCYKLISPILFIIKGLEELLLNFNIKSLLSKMACRLTLPKSSPSIKSVDRHAYVLAI